VLGPLCEVLEEAHGRGVIHRDLKPSNIILVDSRPSTVDSFGSGATDCRRSTADSVKLLDFGIAALRGSQTLTSPTLVSGTAQYMAPEQWDALRNASAASDIYSLGVIAYECLSGRLPFEVRTNSPLAWMKKHCLEAPLPLEAALEGRALPAGLSAVVMRALAKAPAERYPSALELKAALFAALGA
jgi:eukaryotic-like serine/threonine-protein kinase